MVECAVILVFSWMAEAEVLQNPEGWLGTMWHGPSPCTSPEAVPFTSSVVKPSTSLQGDGVILILKPYSLEISMSLAEVLQNG